MNFGQAISSVFRQYFGFRGRARRSEFWWFALFYYSVLIISAIFLPLLYLIFFVAMIIPGSAVLVRRLHDTGRSGWYALSILLPFVNFILFLIFGVRRGDRGANKYGPDPIGSTDDVAPITAEVVLGARGRQDFCTNCGSRLEAGVNYCRSCGTAVRSSQDDVGFCTNCGSALEPSANVCRACGTSV